MPGQLVGIRMAVTNLEAMAEFYRRVLDADLTKVDTGAFSFYRGRIGTLRVQMFPKEVVGITGEQNLHQLLFVVADVEGCRQLALNFGGTPEGELVEEDGRLTCCIRDPDGNTVELANGP